MKCSGSSTLIHVYALHINIGPLQWSQCFECVQWRMFLVIAVEGFVFGAGFVIVLLLTVSSEYTFLLPLGKYAVVHCTSSLV